MSYGKTTSDAEFYVHLQPDFSNYVQDGRRAITGVRATRITQSRPSKPAPNTVLIRLTVRVPDAAFQPLEPQAVVVVPEEFVEHPIEVIAQPRDEQ